MELSGIVVGGITLIGIVVSNYFSNRRLYKSFAFQIEQAEKKNGTEQKNLLREAIDKLKVTFAEKITSLEEKKVPWSKYDEGIAHAHQRMNGIEKTINNGILVLKDDISEIKADTKELNGKFEMHLEFHNGKK